MARAFADMMDRFRQAFVGTECTVVKREHDWDFGFGDGLGLAVAVPWRVVVPEGIAHAEADDRQLFGLKEPINGEQRANELLRGHRVEQIEIDLLTADICIRFDDGVRLDVFNNSSGYEGWTGNLGTGTDHLMVIGQGGGQVSIG